MEFGTVSQSEADGPVTGTGSGIGGLIGILGYTYSCCTPGIVTNVIATGKVTGPTAAASTGGYPNTTGGLVGYISDGSVQAGYAIGQVVNGGGLVGTNSGSGMLNNLYWDVATSGQSVGILDQQATATNVTGIGGTTRRDPTQQSTYQGFDFTNV